MTNKIFKAVLTATVLVLLCSLVLVMGCLYSYFGDVQRSQLTNELHIAAAGVEQGGETYLTTLRGESFRLTWVEADGTVRYDTQTSASDMENHADREEIREALQSGEGDSTRYSATLMEKTLYHAMRLTDGTVLRISVSRASAVLVVLGMLQPILITALVAVILSAVLARRMARRIVQPLNTIDLDHPLDSEPYEELSPLLTRIHQQHRQIETQLREMRRKTDEFNQIIAGMSEGLILLDSHDMILSINPAACRIFGTDESCLGQDFLTVDRGRDMSLALRDASQDGHREIRAERGGREYRFDMNRIESDGAVIGLVLLAFDVTEQSFAERNRREFTANVSHELKTPLQSIMGSAELIENGLVKQEDMSRFVGHIRQESARLVALIEDIIRLSQLDEQEEMPLESVDVLAAAQETARVLTPAAESRAVALTTAGENVCVQGVQRLIYEICYNLCDNAIKYNRDGGTVELAVHRDGDAAVLTVRDTGMGIPPEHQSRIFERFYRVDKSHSKASGGTGLGLSIVKHAVGYHHGTITVNSTVGQGTTFTVCLPLKR